MRLLCSPKSYNLDPRALEGSHGTEIRKSCSKTSSRGNAPTPPGAVRGGVESGPPASRRVSLLIGGVSHPGNTHLAPNLRWLSKLNRSQLRTEWLYVNQTSCWPKKSILSPSAETERSHGRGSGVLTCTREPGRDRPTLPLAGQTDDTGGRVPGTAISHAAGVTPSFLRPGFLGSP